MSNHKYAYGWWGHIITSKANHQNHAGDNVVAVAEEKFAWLVEDMEDVQLDSRIQARQLGLLATGDVYFVATGHSFVDGFTHYGTVFASAYEDEITRDNNKAYIEAMKKRYDITLPPCQKMVGCASEH